MSQILKELEEEVYSNSESLYQYKIENQINEITKTLRKIRLKKKIKQIEIAKRTGLSKQMISKIETANGNPSLSTLVKYCDCIGVDLSELLMHALNREIIKNDINKTKKGSTIYVA